MLNSRAMFPKFISFLFMFAFINSNLSFFCRCENLEGKLIKSLLSKYNINERPIQDHNDSINVKLGMTLQQIIEVNEREQTIQINAWLHYEWFDYRLKWNSNRYNNLTDVRIPSNRLWKPDVLLYNSFDSNFGATLPVNFVVQSSGTITWIPPGILKSLCQPIGIFPFNSQRCFFKFGSWTYDGNKINLTEGDFDSTEYVPSGHWFLKDMHIRKRVKRYKCCPEPYIDVQFVIDIGRRSTFNGFCIISPYVLLSLASLMSFLVSVKSNQKLTLCILILIATCGFAVYLAETLPPATVNFPPIGLFVIFNVTFVATVFLCNVITTCLHHKGDQRVPDWLRDSVIGVFGCQPIRNLVASNEEQRRLLSSRHTSSTATPVRSMADNRVHAAKDAANDTVVYGSVDKSENEECEKQWIIMASIIDKVCFVGFLIIFIVCTFALLINM